MVEAAPARRSGPLPALAAPGPAPVMHLRWILLIVMPPPMGRVCGVVRVVSQPVHHLASRPGHPLPVRRNPLPYKLANDSHSPTRACWIRPAATYIGSSVSLLPNQQQVQHQSRAILRAP